jgi:type III secretory pathway lipoprotein EscJ
VGRWSNLVRGWIAGSSLALSASGCDVTLLRGLSHEQAHDAVAALDRSGVVARIAADGSLQRIDVNDSAVADAVVALNASRQRAQCPAEKESAPASRWIETPGEERARHAEHLSRQLERSLSRLPGVIEAHVHLTLPFGMRSLLEAQTPATASVLLVRTEARSPLTSAATELVAGAVPGLSPQAVRVVETLQPPTAAAKPDFARFGPVVVTRDSASTLKRWLAASLVLHMLLAAALLRPLLRRGAKRVPTSNAPAGDDPPPTAQP